jgi:hypothetical protein
LLFLALFLDKGDEIGESDQRRDDGADEAESGHHHGKDIHGIPLPGVRVKRYRNVAQQMTRIFLLISVIKMAGLGPNLGGRHWRAGLSWSESCDKEASLCILPSSAKSDY